MKKTSFKSLIKNFNTIFLDSYGVVKNYNGLIPGVENTINNILDEGKELRILTNDASRSPSQQVSYFNSLGLRNIEEKHIITSGMMAKNFLDQKIPNGKIAYLGTERAADYILEANLDAVPIYDVSLNDIEDIKALVFLDDEGFDWNRDINTAVNLLNQKNIPAIVANSDQLYPVNNRDLSIATGGIAKLVENILNRKFIHFGKPDSQMFMYAYENLNLERKTEKKDIIMVGDTLHTDILGGNKFGIQTVLVLTGNTRKENADLAVRLTGIIPDYISDSIVN